MKILHVIANLAPRYGGPAKVCVEMAQAVARLGHEASIYTTNQDGPGELAGPLDQSVIKDGVGIHYFPIQPPRFWGASWPLALSRTIKEFDLLHIHSLYLFNDLVAGPDDDGWGAQVKEWLKAEVIPDCATFTGMLLGEGKLAALRDAQMFVLPLYSENFGLAVIEALACGLPVVISDRVNIWREEAAARGRFGSAVRLGVPGCCPGAVAG